jgi:reactive intermediate/imine deaminase
MSRFLLVLALIAPVVQADLEFIQLDPATLKAQPFSDAVVIGDLMILSGQVGTDGSGQLVKGGLVAETQQIFSNMQAILITRNLDLSHIVKCTVMMDDISQWGAFNQVYLSYFSGPKPARSAFGADGLALDARLELECWARMQKEPEDKNTVSSLDRLLKIVEALFQR